MIQLGAIGAYVYAGAFGDEPDNLVSQSNRPEWTLCAFDGDRMVASFATIPFTMRSAGTALPMGGITAVGTLPEYRRRGIVRQLMTRALADMRDKGQPVTALWASQAAIYQRYGFAMTTVMRRYRIDTVDIGFFDGDAGVCKVERTNLTEGYDVLKKIYIEFATDRFCYLHRASPMWQLQILNRNDASGPVHAAIATDAENKPVGYVVFTLRPGKVSHAARSQEITVRDLAWLTPDAYRSLWRFLATHDLVGAIVWDRAPADDPAMDLLAEPRLLNSVDGEGCWFRIVDISPALAGRGYATDGEICIGVTDDTLTPWNDGSWRLTVRDGKGNVEPSRGQPDVSGSTRTLTYLYTGARRASELAAWGLLTGEPQAIANADRLFHTPHLPHCPDNF
jgi:predicted acetyltransferase